jgi:hypothetical protein
VKKLIPLMILGAFLGATVIGCGPGPSTPPAVTSPPDKDKTTDKDKTATTKDKDKS